MEAGTIAASMLAIFFFQTLIFIIVLAPRPEKIHRMIVQSAFIKILGSQSRHEAHHEAVWSEGKVLSQHPEQKPLSDRK